MLGFWGLGESTKVLHEGIERGDIIGETSRDFIDLAVFEPGCGLGIRSLIGIGNSDDEVFNTSTSLTVWPKTLVWVVAEAMCPVLEDFDFGTSLVFIVGIKTSDIINFSFKTKHHKP